jgi:nitrite reductase (NADH) small subunit
VSQNLVVKQKVATVAEIKELEPKIVDVNGTKIAIYKFRDRFLAYLDQCPHQGGPPCEGFLGGNLECEIDLDEGARIRQYKSTEHYSILCPWHGFDYDLETGVCNSNKRYRLKPYKVWKEGEDLLLEL